MSDYSRRRFIRQSSRATLAASLFGAASLQAANDEQKDAPESEAAHSASGSSLAATVHPLATRAAMEMMRSGGTAIDGAVAAALVLGVVDGHNSGIGGGCLMLIHAVGGKLMAIDGRETAPAAASETMYVREGVVDGKLSQDGPLACAVPGQVAALFEAHRSLGKLKWSQLFEPAIHAAISGVPMSRTCAAATQAEKVALRTHGPDSPLVHGTGIPIGLGETLVQPDLANTLTMIAKHGPSWFYQDGFARACVEHLERVGGMLNLQDFVSYHAKLREPLRSTYRGFQIVGFPTPSSGGTHIAQMLSMLEHFSVRQLYESSQAQWYHLLSECMKRAFADRAHWLGDADFVEVPASLLDVGYAQELASAIDLNRSTEVSSHGYPPGTSPSPADLSSSKRGEGRVKVVESDDQGKHTTHLTVVDRFGNWVALTSTINTAWGSKVTVPGTGVVLNNQMDDFSIAPGTPNAFGLIGSQANAIGPKKRPLSSMSPTLVLDTHGVPILTCGAAGGPKIINATLQILVRCLDLGQTVERAVAAPRVHHQWRPDILSIENRFIDQDLDPSRELKKMGHEVKSVSSLAVAQAIVRSAHALVGASDPRVADSTVMSSN